MTLRWVLTTLTGLVWLALLVGIITGTSWLGLYTAYAFAVLLTLTYLLDRDVLRFESAVACPVCGHDIAPAPVRAYRLCDRCAKAAPRP